MQQNHNAAF